MARTQRIGAIAIFALLLVIATAVLTVTTVSAESTPIKSIEYDVNISQVAIVFNQNRIFTFEPKALVSQFLTYPKLVQTFFQSSDCILFDLHTQMIIPSDTTLFEAFVHNDVELRCGDNYSKKISISTDPHSKFTEETIESMSKTYLTSVNEQRPYPNDKNDLLYLSLSTLIGWARLFLEYHWGPIHPFPVYPSDSETLRLGEENVGIYHFNGKQLSQAQSQKMALESSKPLNLRENIGKDYITIFGITADWGSGTEESDLVTNLIKNHNPHYTINMGDLYLVGTPDEARKHALGIRYSNDTFDKAVKWLPGSLGSFWIPGNHELYSRGYGVFDYILPNMGIVDQKTGKIQGQSTSYQLLENEHWRILLLDTGYTTYSTLIHNDDNRFNDDIINWLKNVVKIDNKQDKRGIIILTHHNFMSAFSSRISSGPAEQLRELIGNKTVLTMWGHEHKTAIYAKSDIGLLNAYPRCMGTGGFPVDHIPIPPTASASKLIAYDNRLYDTINGDFGSVPAGYNGYYTMNFTGPQVRINYFTTRWKDEEKKILDWDLSQITMTETFTTDYLTGDIVQKSFNVLDQDITIIDNIVDEEEEEENQKKKNEKENNKIRQNFYKTSKGDRTYYRQSTIGDFEDLGIDMDTYYQSNKDKRFTQPVGLNAKYTEDATKDALKQHIKQSLASSTSQNQMQNLTPEEIMKMLTEGKSAVKNKMKSPRAMTVDDITKANINYNELVNVDGHYFPKINFD